MKIQLKQQSKRNLSRERSMKQLPKNVEDWHYMVSNSDFNLINRNLCIL